MLAGYSHLLAVGRRLQWDCDAIDLIADRERWRSADAGEREHLLALLAGFWVAERQVASELSPFIESADGNARECFELQAGDERRHAVFFERVVREVAGLDPEEAANRWAPEAILELFEAALPEMASALAGGRARLETAIELYHLVLEAIVLTTGQAALLEVARDYPGIASGVARVQADERWHVGLGVQTLSHPGDGPSDKLDPLAREAARAWGPRVASDERVERVLAAHRRREALLARTAQRRHDMND
jgi:ribonucleoside-diphosphate reductase beta chain